MPLDAKIFCVSNKLCIFQNDDTETVSFFFFFLPGDIKTSEVALCPCPRINHSYPCLMFTPFKYLWAVMFLYYCLPTLGTFGSLAFLP